MPNMFVDVQPPSPAPGAVRIYASGGLGEIGRNMTVFQHEADCLIVDCGVLFPSRYEPGIDLILPDLEQLDRAGASPQWIFLTHGHEDHIGALPYLLRRFPELLVLGSQLTLALARARLSEHGIVPAMSQVEAGDQVQLGGFLLRFLAVAHSVPDSLGVEIEVGGRRILHTGDFRVDEHPLDGRQTDLGAFRDAGERGVDLLLSDSTNADVGGQLLEERDITDSLNEIFNETVGRVIFACFASNVHRVQQAVNAAVGSSRKLSFVGRSMVRNMGIAQELGFLKVPGSTEVSYDDLSQLPAQSTVLVCTGSQGEPLSALARMARGQHKVQVSQDDTVILSARLIPGNEEDIFRVINGLSKRGVRVLHRDNATVHASGHAGAVDLARIVQLAKPKHFLPIHGEWRHLQAHAKLAVSAGLREESVLLLGNGDVVDLVGDVALVVGSYGHNDIYVDGTSVGHTGRRVIQDRTTLAQGGLILAVLAIGNESGQLLEAPTLDLRGVTDSGSLRSEAREKISAVVATWSQSSRDLTKLEAMTVQSLKTWLKREYTIAPLVVVSIVSV